MQLGFPYCRTLLVQLDHIVSPANYPFLVRVEMSYKMRKVEL